jgi:hypothetical protein
MKPTVFDRNKERVTDLYQRVMKRYENEVIDQLTKFGDPEKLLGKPYELWTPQDLVLLGQIYGTEPDSILEKFLAKKAKNRMYELEK